jgi:hypothetical protein
MRRQALAAGRRMIRDGELLPRELLRERLAVTDKLMKKLESEGSLFAIEIDGVQYFPALFADQNHDRNRLFALCRLIVPAPADARHGYLTAPQYLLGDVSPLELIATDEGYKKARFRAKVWAATWSRTVVKIYIGDYLSEPEGIEPAYTAIIEIDPRLNVWRRASTAMRSRSNVSPPGSYSRAHTATVFVTRRTAGRSGEVLDAYLGIKVNDDVAQVQMTSISETPYFFEAVPVADSHSVVDTVLKVVAVARLNASKWSSYNNAARQINAEFDIRQYDVSALIHTIAANKGHLSSDKRDRYQYLPSEVVSRIEDIVRTAFCLKSGQ